MCRHDGARPRGPAPFGLRSSCGCRAVPEHAPSRRRRLAVVSEVRPHEVARRERCEEGELAGEDGAGDDELLLSSEEEQAIFAEMEQEHELELFAEQEEEKEQEEEEQMEEEQEEVGPAEPSAADRWQSLQIGRAHV